MKNINYESLVNASKSAHIYDFIKCENTEFSPDSLKDGEDTEAKKIMSPGGTTVGLANWGVLADDKKIYSADNLKVGLFK